MDTSAVAVLLYYILCLVLALTVISVITVYRMRLSSSKSTRELKREGGQREESAREEKAERRPVLNSSSVRGIHKQAISPSMRNKAGEQIEPIEVRKQVQPKNTAPAESSEPTVALKDDSASHAALPDVSHGQSAITKPKSGEKPPDEQSAGDTSGGERKRVNVIPSPTRDKAGKQIEAGEEQVQVQEKDTAPIRRLQPKGPLKPYSSSKHISIAGTPQEQSAITDSKNGEEPAHESSPDNTSPAGKKNDPAPIAEPAHIGKESESSMETKPGTDVNQASADSPAATTDSGETDKEMPQKQKSGLGDLADLFATSASEFTEKDRLAEQVNDVDVNELLREGLGLLGKVKQSNG